MASITRTKKETVATVAAANRSITVTVLKTLTIEESKELRKLLKAEEATAAKQSNNPFGHTYSFSDAWKRYGII